ncbi:MAG: hypothetical protein ACK5II_02775 [Paracoccus sp. (in: a-proteobacteria)]
MLAALALTVVLTLTTSMHNSVMVPGMTYGTIHPSMQRFEITFTDDALVQNLTIVPEIPGDH